MKTWFPFGVALGLVLLGAFPDQAQTFSPLCRASKQAVVALADTAKPIWLQDGGDSSIQATCTAE